MIRLARLNDMEIIGQMIFKAKQYHIKNNINQWNKIDGYPSSSDILNDIHNKKGYLYQDQENYAYFAMSMYEEDYSFIEGAWLNDKSYIVIHRLMASDYSKHIASFIFKYLQNIYHNIKIDTHIDNLAMNKCLLNNGFEKCGTIYIRGNQARVAYQWFKDYNKDMELNKYIDHTLLKMDASEEQITQLCNQAIKYNFKSVCVNPGWVKYCARLLKDSEVEVCTVVGFPLGATSTQSKALETSIAIADGADEIDMVINVGFLKSRKYDEVLNDIKEVVSKANGKVVKVILETCLLDEKEIVKACELSMQAKADFVKTSTGFSIGGATLEAVKLMADTVKPVLKVKASGGIKDKQTALKMIEAGADRLGTSSGTEIVQ